MKKGLKILTILLITLLLCGVSVTIAKGRKIVVSYLKIEAKEQGSIEKLGLLIPLYAYPNFNEDSNNDGIPNYKEKNWWFNQFIDALKDYPDISKIVIVNPNSGPGTSQDKNYTEAIQWLHNAGATVIGYVSTAYSVYNPDNPHSPGRTLTEVKNDIDSWLKFYPKVDGIFLDELPWKVSGDNGEKALQYYISLTNYAHKNGLYPVVGNPGTEQENNAYFTNDAYDIAVIYENKDYPLLSNVTDGNDPHRKAILIHSVSENRAEIKQHISELKKAADYFWVWRDDTWGSDTTTWNDTGFANFVRDVANAVQAKNNGGSGNPKTDTIISYPEEKWPTAKIDKNGNGIPEYVMEINPWNIKGANGKAVMSYDKRRGVFNYLQDLINIKINNPGGYVLGYPEVYYGNKPWEEHSATDGNIPLPEKVSNLSNFYVTLNYDLHYAQTLPVDLAMESWLTKDKWRSTGVHSGEEEMMIWFYYNGLQPAGFKIGQITVPIKVNGKSVNATFEVWKGDIGWEYVAFRLKKPIQSGTVTIPYLPFVNKAKSISSIQNYSSLYLEDVEIGTEFGSPNTTSAKLSWTLYKFELNASSSQKETSSPIWPMFRYNAKHTGRSPYDTSKNNGVLKWKYAQYPYGMVKGKPAISPNGTIYVGTTNGYLLAVDSLGTLKWKYKTSNGIAFSPVIAKDGTIYVGTLDNYLYAVNSVGSLKWKYKIGSEVWSSPAIAPDGTIYIGTTDGYLLAINPLGTLKWEYKVRSGVISSIYSSPAVAPDGTIYVAALDGYLYAINPNGTLKWNYDTGSGIFSSPAVATDGTVYVAARSRYLFAIYPDGTLKWKCGANDKILSSPVIAPDGTIYVTTRGDYLLAINSDGTLKWSYRASNGIYSSPSIAKDGTIYYSGAFDDYLYAINPVGTLKWKYETGDEIVSSPAIAPDGTIYVASHNGYLFAVNLGGLLKWKYEIGSRIFSSPSIATDGTIYYVDECSGYLYAVNPDGTLKWNYRTGSGLFSSPAIGTDGTIYVGSWNGYLHTTNPGYLYAINPNGTLKWKYKTQTGSGIISSPAVSTDGTIYVGTIKGYLLVFNPDGSLKWKYDINSGTTSSIDLPPNNASNRTMYLLVFNSKDKSNSKYEKGSGIISSIISSPAISPDGTIYVGGTNGYLYAFNPDGTLKWKYNTGSEIDSSVAIATDGTVYVGGADSYLYALNPNGTLKWKYKTGGEIWSSPAIAKDGTIYIGSEDGYLYAVNPGGTLKWKYKTYREIESSPAISSNGTIYVGSEDGYLYAVNPGGTLKWSYKTGDGIASSPAISSDGTVYIGSGDGYLYAIGNSSIAIPSAPKNLKATVSNSSINLTWDPSTKGTYPIAGYAIYRGTEQGKEDFTKPIATVDANTTTYKDKNIEFNKTYYYVVKAYDNQSPPDYSNPSNEVKVEIKDTTPPVVTVTSPNDFEIVNEDTVTVSGTATDDLSGVSKVTVNGNDVSVSSDGSFNTTVNLAEGENTITVTAIDKAENKASKTITVTYKKPAQTIVITLQPDNPMMTVNGGQKEIDPGRGTKPVIIPKWGRTVVPIRAIVEALGGTIGWNAKEREVTINFKDTVINLWIGKPQAEVNGIMKWIDPNNYNVKPIIVNDRTMLPLRFVAESLGCTVDWNGATKTITITYSG